MSESHWQATRRPASRLLGFRDVLLVGFFLSIGLGGAPESPGIVMAGIALALVGLKTAGYLVLQCRLRLRARTSLHTSLTLATYSEFGLIVASVAVDQSFLD